MEHQRLHVRTNELSAEIVRLLRDRIEDYEQLEILRLMWSNRDAWWTAAQVAARLPLDAERVEAACLKLEKSQLSRSRMEADLLSFTYAPAPAHIGLLVDQLFLAYRDYPIEVVKHMSANAIERVRTAALQAFADAFVIGRNKK
jgi:hypothetical protein